MHRQPLVRAAAAVFALPRIQMSGQVYPVEVDIGPGCLVG